MSNPNNDVGIQPMLPDGASCLQFSSANWLAAGCWDNKVYCWEVSQSGVATARTVFKHEAPVLCVDWSPDGSKLFTGGCDKAGKMWNLETKQGTQVAGHDNAISRLTFIESHNYLLTGSWDKTLKYWDTRASSPVLSVTLPERVYCLDVVSPLLVVATAERHILIYDVKQPQKPFREMMSPLKFQSRSLGCFSDKTGFALGSIEGRVAIQYVDTKRAANNFAFKCHREGSDVHSVNSINFHKFGTFATAGSDGSYVFWDKDSKHRLKGSERMNNTISCACFNRAGNIYAYALSYDWCRGVEGYDKAKGNSIYLHPVQDTDVRPRPK